MECGDIDLTKVIRKVELELPKSYGGKPVDISFPFQFSAIGGSTFLLPIKIHWQPWLGLPIYSIKHRINFSSDLFKGFFVLKVPKCDFVCQGN